MTSPNPVLCILAVLSPEQEHLSLKQILGGSEWTLVCVQSLREARAALRSSPVEVVLSGILFSDGHGWKDLLRLMQDMTDPPQLIVSDRLADEALWAEVLNLGAFDLLREPWDANEVTMVLQAAVRYRGGTAARDLSRGAG